MDEIGTAESAYYFTFRLGDEVFAIDIGKVKEIVEILKITRVPQSPEFKLGVINLRGNIVPIIELHQKFKLERFEPTIDSAIVIVETTIDDELVTIGAVVDQVEEVAKLQADSLSDALEIGSRLKHNFISGIAKQGENFVIILDVENIFSYEELVMSE